MFLGAGSLLRALLAAHARRKARIARQVAQSTQTTRTNAHLHAEHQRQQHVAQQLTAAKAQRRQAMGRVRAQINRLGEHRAAQKKAGVATPPKRMQAGTKLRAGPQRIAQGGAKLAGVAQRGRAVAGWAAWRKQGAKGAKARAVGQAVPRGVAHAVGELRGSAQRAVGAVRAKLAAVAPQSAATKRLQTAGTPKPPMPKGVRIGANGVAVATAPKTAHAAPQPSKSGKGASGWAAWKALNKWKFK